MKDQNAILETDIEFDGTILRFYKNCPKPDGWFGCYMDAPGIGYGIEVTGTFDLFPATVGLTLHVVANKCMNSYNNRIQYQAVTMSIPTTDYKTWKKYFSGPLFPGIGVKTAEKLVERYKQSVVSMLLDHHDQVQTDLGLTDKQIKMLRAGVAKNHASVMILTKFPHLEYNDLIHILNAYNNDHKIILQIMKKDPYSLTAIEHVSFRSIDIVAREDCKIAEDDDRRLRCILVRAIQHFMNDKRAMYVNRNNPADIALLFDKINHITGKQSSSIGFLNLCINAAMKTRMVVQEDYNGEVHLYNADMKSYEHDMVVWCDEYIHDNVADVNFAASSNKLSAMLNNQIMSDKIRHNFWLNPDQEKALYFVMTHPFCIVTGGPGRGKTRLIESLVRYWCDSGHNDHDNIVVLAPTGKAVNRLREDAHLSCVETVDRCLVRNRERYEHGLVMVADGFVKIGSQTLVIVDEASMLDIAKADKLINLFFGCRFVFVGDQNQLPPISPGAFFSEMIKSGRIPVFTLTKNMRTSAQDLNDNADRVANSVWPLLPSGNFSMFPRDDDAVAMKDAVDTYVDHIRNGCDYADILLMSPVKKQACGVSSLNRELQSRLLGPVRGNVRYFNDLKRRRTYIDAIGHEIMVLKNDTDDVHFHIGDRVINTKNHMDIDWVKYKHDDIDANDVTNDGYGIFNGDTGVIKRFYPASPGIPAMVMIRLDDGRFVEISFNNRYEFEFELGYCITVHKAQGSDAAHVLIVMPQRLDPDRYYNQHLDSGFLNQNLLYTAMTRAKQSVDLFGSMKCIKHCVETKCETYNSVLWAKIADACK